MEWGRTSRWKVGRRGRGCESRDLVFCRRVQAKANFRRVSSAVFALAEVRSPTGSTGLSSRGHGIFPLLRRTPTPPTPLPLLIDPSPGRSTARFISAQKTGKPEPSRPSILSPSSPSCTTSLSSRRPLSRCEPLFIPRSLAARTRTDFRASQERRLLHRPIHERLGLSHDPSGTGAEGAG